MSKTRKPHLVPQCAGCVNASQVQNICEALTEPRYQWRDGRYCWSRALLERAMRVADRGAVGGTVRARRATA